ncbi:MAG: hypothetical protein L0H12_02665, partial [Nitrosospira sp.]|nr:hypothetical protein [Nitrosospira sp.]
QLLPPKDRLQHPRVTVVPVSQITLSLEGTDSAAIFKRVQDQILKWVGKRAGRPLPERAWKGESFELDDVGAQRAAAVSLVEPQYWAARFDDADRNVPQRTWVTEISIGGTNDRQVLFGARLTCVSRGEDRPFERSVPGFVRQIVDIGCASLDGRFVDEKPWFVVTENDVINLVNLLRDPRRQVNVIVFSLPEDSENEAEAVANAARVHTGTIGAAHVVIISGPASFLLSNYIGKEFSVFRQAIRTYRPGFDSDRDQPFAHPLAMPDRVRSWSDGGVKTFENFLIEQTLSVSVALGDLHDKLPSFATVCGFAAKQSRKIAETRGSSDKELLALALEDNERLTNELHDQKKTYDGLLKTIEREKEEAFQARDEVKASNRTLRVRIEYLEQRIKEGQQAEVPIPTTLDRFEEWCQKHLAGAVEIHNRAYHGVKKSEYESPSFLYQALLLLRDYYVPMRRNGGGELANAYKSECARLHLKESPTFSGSSWGEEGETYFVNYSGQRRILERHLKKGISRNTRRCFRLYFFWDDESQNAVVGWLPSHLENRMT